MKDGDRILRPSMRGEGPARFGPWIALAVLLVLPLAGAGLLALVLVRRAGFEASGWMLAALAASVAALGLAWRSMFRWIAGFIGLAREIEDLAEQTSVDPSPGTRRAAVDLTSARGALRGIHRKLGATMAEIEDRARQLEETNAKLKRMDERKTEFLSAVSHELRTPLTAIRSFAEILGRYGDEEEAERRRYVGIIIRETDRLTSLIDDILNLARIESGRVSWNLGLHDLGEIVRSSTAVLEPVVSEKGLAFRIRVDPDLPKALVDPDKIRQVMVNLVGNAVKFTPRGGVVTVEVENRGAEAGLVSVAVSDTGVGIPPDQIDFIFDRFVQARSRSGRGKRQGTGLGLPISKEIVEAHGGSITVRSGPSEGSQFAFTVPAWAGESLFRTYLRWRIGYSQRKEEKFALAVMEGPEGMDERGIEGFREAVHGMVRSSDMVVRHDRPGMIALMATTNRAGAERILGRVRERLAARGVARGRAIDAIVSYPDDGAGMEALVAGLDEAIALARGAGAVNASGPAGAARLDHPLARARDGE